MTRRGTLKKSVVALRIKEPLFIESRLLKAVIDVGGNDEIIFIFYKFEKLAIDGFGRICVAIDEDIPRPIRPMSLGVSYG